jgi:hypothetical protein
VRRTYRLNAVFLALIAAAFVAPRFVPRGEGFASGAMATLTFLAILLLAVLVAVGQAIWTVRARARLSRRERWLGCVPALLGVAGFAALIAWLRF